MLREGPCWNLGGGVCERTRVVKTQQRALSTQQQQSASSSPRPTSHALQVAGLGTAHGRPPPEFRAPPPVYRVDEYKDHRVASFMT